MGQKTTRSSQPRIRHLPVDVVIPQTTLLCMRWNRLFHLWKWN